MDDLTHLDTDTFKVEFLVPLTSNDVLGRTADIMPAVDVHGALQFYPIELSVTQDHLCASRNQGVELFRQGEVDLLGLELATEYTTSPLKKCTVVNFRVDPRLSASQSVMYCDTIHHRLGKT